MWKAKAVINNMRESFEKLENCGFFEVDFFLLKKDIKIFFFL